MRCSYNFPEKVKKAADSQTQNAARKKLADISNQPQNRKPLIQEKSPSIETATKEYIHKLQKVMLLADHDLFSWHVLVLF